MNTDVDQLQREWIPVIFINLQMEKQVMLFRFSIIFWSKDIV